MNKLCFEKMRLRDRLAIERCYRVGFSDTFIWGMFLLGVAYIMAHLMLWAAR